MWPLPLRKNRRSSKSTTSEINIWRVKALFNNFRKILQLNTIIFENMAEMDRSLGGEFIFDKNYLEQAVRTIASNVHHVTYNLNALTNNSFIPLYDRYQAIRIILDDILAGNDLSIDCPPVLAFGSLNWEIEPLVGIEFICLAELRHHPVIQMIDGFIITANGTQTLCGSAEDGLDTSSESTQKELQKSVLYNFSLLHQRRGSWRFSICATQTNNDAGEVANFGEFLLETIHGKKDAHILELNLPNQTNNTKPSAVNASSSTAPDLYQGLIQIVEKLRERAQQHNPDSPPRFAVLVRSCPPVAVHGAVVTRTDSLSSAPLLSVTAHLSEDTEIKDIYHLRRLYPFDLFSSNIAPKPAGHVFADGRMSSALTGRNRDLRRGSALLAVKDIKALAETAMTLERIMGIPVIMHWEWLRDEEFVITRLFPYLEKPEEPTGKELDDELQAATVLCRGGRVVQSGVAAGIVVHVTDDTEVTDFPLGAVAVAPMATPQLTPILHRAAAILTEHGNPVGHLATVARELSLPALFGVANVLEKLPQGTHITVDAGLMTVYQGTLNAMLQLGNSDLHFSPVDPEYRLLRRLLRYITPLNVINPDTPQFCAEGCQSFHDIIHFCHEMAVDELAHFQERRPGLSGITTATMHLDVPMEIHLLDIGGGMRPSTGSQPQPADVSSEPFAVFLDGLLHPRARQDELPTLGLRDIISSIPRTSGIISSSPSDLGKNLAILSQDYLNLSLHLGYHFNVIDAHLSDDRHRNYIYFRFIGGLADATRRARRAHLIRDVLKAMDFKVSCKDDLVVGRIKFERKENLRASLFVLGALTAFTRQRDTSLYSDGEVRELYRLFADRFLLPFRQKNRAQTERVGKTERVSDAGSLSDSLNSSAAISSGSGDNR